MAPVCTFCAVCLLSAVAALTQTPGAANSEAAEVACENKHIEVQEEREVTTAKVELLQVYHKSHDEADMVEGEKSRHLIEAGDKGFLNYSDAQRTAWTQTVINHRACMLSDTEVRVSCAFQLSVDGIADDCFNENCRGRFCSMKASEYDAFCWGTDFTDQEHKDYHQYIKGWLTCVKAKSAARCAQAEQGQIQAEQARTEDLQAQIKRLESDMNAKFDSAASKFDLAMLKGDLSSEVSSAKRDVARLASAFNIFQEFRGPYTPAYILSVTGAPDNLDVNGKYTFMEWERANNFPVWKLDRDDGTMSDVFLYLNSQNHWCIGSLPASVSSCKVWASVETSLGKMPDFEYGTWEAGNGPLAISVFPGPYLQGYVTQAQGGDWTTASCGEGYYVIGGGCHAETLFAKSGPQGDKSWECGGHANHKTVYAICSSERPSIATATVNDWGTATCGEGLYLTGGGCASRGGQHKFQYNGPDAANPSTSWLCGGFGGPKDVWAICSRDEPLRKESVGGDWTVVMCDEGYTAVGGGCNALSDPWTVSYNGPSDDDAGWTCGGTGSQKHVWVMCERKFTW